MKEKIFIKTDNINKILKSTHDVIQKNGWIAVTGEPGTGKTEILRYLCGEWKKEPQKYIVISSTTWKRPGSRISMLMRDMIRAISPGEHIPGSVELRAERVKTCLMRAAAAKKKVIVAIDECSDMTEDTLREIKKIHEITALSRPHLFSIVMFGKNTAKLNYIFENPEVGFRCNRVYTNNLESPEEILSFAQDVFGLEFPSGKEGEKAKRYFYEMVYHTPLGVQNLVENIQFTGSKTATVDAIRKALSANLKETLKMYGISMAAIAKKSGYSLTTVKDTINHKPGYSSKVKNAINSSINDMLQSAQDADKVAV